MIQVCPINDKRVNENVTRLNAFITALLIVAYLFTGWYIIPIFLSIDFFFRAFNSGKYSLLCLINKKVVEYFGIKNIQTNAGPKFFAAKIGFVFSLAILVSSITGLQSLALILSLGLVFFASLEFAFGICVACLLYPYLNIR